MIFKIIVLMVFIIINNLYAQSKEGEIIILSDKIGEVIDLEERNQYKLFPASKGFQSAVLYKLPDGTYYFEISFLDETTGEEKQYRISRSTEEINQLRDHISLTDSSRKEDTGPTLVPQPVSSDTVFSNDFDLVAQSFYLGDLAYRKPRTSLRFLHPRYEYRDYSFLSGIYDYYLNTPISSEFNLLLNVPFVMVAEDIDIRSNRIGNVFIGFQQRSTLKGKTLQSSVVGIFFPTSGGAYASGSVPNNFELPKYLSHTLSIQWKYIHRYTISTLSHVGFEISPHLLVFVSSENVDFNSIFISYGTFFDYMLYDLNVRCELLGSIYGLAADTENNFNHAVIVGLSYRSINLFYHVPLSEEDDYRNLKNIIGLRLNFFLESY